MMEFLKNLSQRIFFIYLVIALIFIFVFQGQVILYKTRLQTLNRIKPESFQPLKDILEKNLPVNPKDLNEYVFYYEKIAQYVRPLSGDIFGILGYCYYLSGDVEKSVKFLEKAAVLSPDYFWYPYNLGLLALQNKNYTRAADYFQKAQKIDTQKSVLLTVSSIQIFMPLAFNRGENIVFWLARRLEDGIQESKDYLNYAQYQINQGSEELKETGDLIQPHVNPINLQVF